MFRFNHDKVLNYKNCLSFSDEFNFNNVKKTMPSNMVTVYCKFVKNCSWHHNLLSSNGIIISNLGMW